MSTKADPQRRPNKASGSSLVFLGAFNPAIFQPAWFMRYGLIPDKADAVQEVVVTPQITTFHVDWLKVGVEPERCSLEASDETPSVKALHDLAIGIFELLPHTPVRAFGVNRYTHFALESVDAWNALGFSLFTTEPWDGVLDDARMRTIQVEDRAKLHGEDQAVMTVTVQPSVLFERSVFVTTNDHYAFHPDPKDPTRVMERLDEAFDSSMVHSDEIIERIRAL